MPAPVCHCTARARWIIFDPYGPSRRRHGTGRTATGAGSDDRDHEPLTPNGMARPDTPERQAKRALNRLRRSLEKCIREMDALDGAIRQAEGVDFPASDYDEARDGVARLLQFLDLEETRLREKVLAAGGLEPGRVRRSSETT